MKKELLITNCRPFDAGENGRTTSIFISNGLITKIGQTNASAARDSVLDAQGRIAAPGLIDVHIQGAGGADVLDTTGATISKSECSNGQNGKESRMTRILADYQGHRVRREHRDKMK